MPCFNEAVYREYVTLWSTLGLPPQALPEGYIPQTPLFASHLDKLLNKTLHVFVKTRL